MYEVFIIKAKIQDKRNIFNTAKVESCQLPKEVVAFYQIANPLDVEVTILGNSVRFYQLTDLKQLQKDYFLDNDCFVFATCNSDPIYLKKHKVYTCCHGTKETKAELLANSFDEYLQNID